MIYYTGIGSRQTPDDVLQIMFWLGRELASALQPYTWTLRSGGAPGADSAFEYGCDALHGLKEIFIPWQGFAERKFGIVVNNPEATKIARSVIPHWHNLSRGGKLLHTRNVCQVLGENLNTPSSVVVCWTYKGEIKGGTATAIKIARKYNIPVINLGSPEYNNKKGNGIIYDAAYFLQEIEEKVYGNNKQI